MCHLKIAEASAKSSDTQQSLTDCIQDCNSALNHAESSKKTNSNLRGKILFRRAKARVKLSIIQDSDDTSKENLNAAEKDLLQLHSFTDTAIKKEGAKLLRETRALQFDLFLRGVDVDIDMETFTLPPRADCPICMTLLPFDCTQSVFQVCCGKIICSACYESTFYSGVQRGDMSAFMHRCVMCRGLPGEIGQNLNPFAGNNALVEKLVDKGNPDAMYMMAQRYLKGIEFAPLDVKKGMELYHMAAVAGHDHACRELGLMYMKGENGLSRDIEKYMTLLIAAIRLGDPGSLHLYGQTQQLLQENGTTPMNLPKTCFLKSASAGSEIALDTVKELYTAKDVTKEEYTEALRSYQTVQGEINSDARKLFLKRRANKSTLLDNVEGSDIPRKALEILNNMVSGGV